MNLPGWPSFQQVSSPPPREDPPSATSRLSANNGSGRVGVGFVLLLVGGVLLAGTLGNPVFAPALGLRAPVDEGTAAVEVPEAGDYVVYLESDECRGGDTQLVRVGERPVPLTAVTNPDYRNYYFEERCAEPLGTASIPVAGLWTATLSIADDAAVVLYPADDRPTSIDWGLSWLFLPALVAGVVLVGQGLVRNHRWRRSLRQLST